MFKNYLKIAFRNLRKEKLYSCINISGLAIGLACCILILLYVQKELSYDQFHENKDSIYRIELAFINGGQSSTNAWVTQPVASKVKEVIPEVERITQVSVSGKNTIITKENQLFYEEKFAYVTPDFFEIFSFEVVSGDPSKSLASPFTLLLSQSMIEKYFPDEDPIGKTLLINNEHTYTISGVYADFPDNSHIDLDFIASRESQFTTGDVEKDNWTGGGAFTYALVNDHVDENEFSQKIDLFSKNYILKAFGQEEAEVPSIGLHTTKLTDIHLYSNSSSEQIPQGDILYIYIFSAIAFLILIIACINYINLTTTRSINRSREIGVRKTSGALRSQLIKQYLGESFVTVFVAILLSVVLAELLLPKVNELLARSLELNWLSSSIVIGILGLWVLVSLGAGLYPAFFLSRFKPIDALKSGSSGIPSKGWLRKGLVVFQLGMSVILVICMITIQRQMQLIQDMRPGFDQERVLMIPNTDKIDLDFNTLQTQLKTIPGVEYVSTNSFEPGIAGGITFLDGDAIEGGNEDNRYNLSIIEASYNFPNTFGLKILQGRSFSEEYSTDKANSILINKSAAKMFGWEDPIGKSVKLFGSEKSVIGVIEDFPVNSIKEKIDPLAVHLTNTTNRLISIRIAPGAIPNTIAEVETLWKTIAPSIPFKYTFLDEAFDALYRTEIQLNLLLTSFAIFAILVACLGLIGLSAFTAQQRTKEIGIRKVLGASIAQIISLLASEFVKWFVLGLSIAIPASYLIMGKWLKAFEYAIPLNARVFIIAGVTCLGFVILAVSWQSIRAASANPVESLKSE